MNNLVVQENAILVFLLLVLVGGLHLIKLFQICHFYAYFLRFISFQVKFLLIKIIL